jgi:hypothetical protein
MMVRESRDTQDNTHDNPRGGEVRTGFVWLDIMLALMRREGLLVGIIVGWFYLIGMPDSLERRKTLEATQQAATEMAVAVQAIQRIEADQMAKHVTHFQLTLEQHTEHQKALIENQKVLEKLLTSKFGKDGGT